MSQQCNYCESRDKCKISLWSVEYILNQSTGKFGRISNSIEISWVGHLVTPLLWHHGTWPNHGCNGLLLDDTQPDPNQIWCWLISRGSSEIWIKKCALSISRNIFSPQYSGRTSHNSPIRVSYGVSFVSSWWEQSFRFLPYVIWSILCYIWLRYSGSL